MTTLREEAMEWADLIEFCGLHESVAIMADQPREQVENDLIAWLRKLAATTTKPAPGGVHDHGPTGGPGVECREYLIGRCRLQKLGDAQ